MRASCSTLSPAFFPRPQQQAAPDLRLSVAVLLLEAARQDDNFDARERAVIMALLARRFDLSPEECEKLIAAAQAHAAELVQLHGHTSAIAAAMSPEERVELIEMLWGVAYADGVLDPEEDLLIRRIAGPGLCQRPGPGAGPPARAGAARAIA